MAKCLARLLLMIPRAHDVTRLPASRCGAGIGRQASSNPDPTVWTRNSSKGVSSRPFAIRRTSTHRMRTVRPVGSESARPVPYRLELQHATQDGMVLLTWVWIHWRQRRQPTQHFLRSGALWACWPRLRYEQPPISLARARRCIVGSARRTCAPLASQAWEQEEGDVARNMRLCSDLCKQVGLEELSGELLLLSSERTSMAELIRGGLDSMEAEWRSVRFATKQHRFSEWAGGDGTITLLRSVNEIKTLTNDHNVKLSMLMASPFIKTHRWRRL